MLSIPGNNLIDCDGVTRRELLRVGGAGFLGLSLPEFLALEARADTKKAAEKNKGAAGFGSAELLLAPVKSIWLACALLFLAGVSFTTWSSNANSIVQLQAPDHLRGRVIGLYFFAFAGTGSLGGLISGWLIHVGGTRLAFLVAGVAAIGGSGVIARLLRLSRAPMRADEVGAERLAA